MNQQQGVRLAYILVIINAVIIGFSFLFTKIALEQAAPGVTLTYRFAVSFIVMSIPVLLGRMKLQLRGKPIHLALLLSTIYPFGFLLLQAFGLTFATSSEGGILYAFTPILTAIIAFIFLKERTTLLQGLFIALSVSGVVFIFVMKGGTIDTSNHLGIALLFLSCLTFSGYSVLARSLLRQFTPAEISYVMIGTGFMSFLAYSLIKHAASGTMNELIAPLKSGSFVAAIVYLGILATLVTAMSTNYALSKLQASKVSVFSNLSTVVSIAAGAWLLGEQVAYYHMIGSALIIAGVWGANRKKQAGKPSQANLPVGKASLDREAAS